MRNILFAATILASSVALAGAAYAQAGQTTSPTSGSANNAPLTPPGSVPPQSAGVPQTSPGLESPNNAGTITTTTVPDGAPSTGQNTSPTQPPAR